MELLIAKDPSIFPALLQGPNNKEALAEFAGRVESLDHGLFDQLQSSAYTYEDFMNAAVYIIDRLYDGDTVKALAAVTK